MFYACWLVGYQIRWPLAPRRVPHDGITRATILLALRYGSKQLMAVTREQFESGMTYDAYKAQMTRNREQFEQNEKDLQLKPEDVEAFRGLPQSVNVLALAEDWCGDVVANRPVLGRLEQEAAGKLRE